MIVEETGTEYGVVRMVEGRVVSTVAFWLLTLSRSQASWKPSRSPCLESRRVT